MDGNSACESSHYPFRSVVISGFLSLTICCAGLLGNCICVTLLIRKYFRRSVFRVYLSTLCVTDSLTLLCCLFTLALPILTEYLGCEADVQNSVSHIIIVCYPIGVMAEGASTLTTAAISVLRFLSVRYPLKTRTLARPEVARCLIALILMTTFLINSPRLMELRLKPCLTLGPEGVNVTVMQVTTTSMRENVSYKTFYLFYGCTVMLFALPFLTILICNVSISLVLLRSWRHSNGGTRHGGSSTQNELMATRLIVFLCLSFLCCHSLPFVINGLEASSRTSSFQGAEVYSTMVDVSNLLIVVKASGNFLLYLTFNRKFRQGVAQSRLWAAIRFTAAQVGHVLFPRRYSTVAKTPRAPVVESSITDPTVGGPGWGLVLSTMTDNIDHIAERADQGVNLDRK